MRQAGALPFHYTSAGNLEFLLITSRRAGRWIIPKGNIDRGDSLSQTAAREALEEAGITGTLSSRSIGSYFYDKQATDGVSCRTEVVVFPLAVAADAAHWREAAVRQKLWVTPHDAALMVDNDGLRTILIDFELTHRNA